MRRSPLDATIDSHIGRRVREIRSWRGMSLTELADLCGWTPGYVSRIERGLRPVTKRATLDTLAAALRVAPSELAEQAFPPSVTDPERGVQSVVLALEPALSDLQLGTGGDSSGRPWAAVAAEMNHLNNTLRPNADYAAEGAVLPGLLHDLHHMYVTDPKHRVEILQAMLSCYQAAAAMLKNLGVRGLPTLAAFHARQVAEELNDPAWLGLAAWVGASTLGGESRRRIVALSERGAEQLEPHLDDRRALQVYGMFHLNASLSLAALDQHAKAVDHLDEAGRIADRYSPPKGHGFANLSFGQDNVGTWRLAATIEMGEAGRAREVARKVHPERLDSATRQAMFWADLGRGLAQQRATREEAVAALMRAEKLAPQRIRAYPLVRETVGDLMRRTRREAVGRDLRGLGYRMGLGVQ